ncbi:Tyrosine kinase receptor Cad96Ca [Apostichopus japonicus]|uniref:Tyrosine kinase receptor Cad96Ca n=1 Tax=Stichopus japonicus TaxID=307972 RepID=A0A2G8LA68_STIJA|nr:Tyrosine kinase receptor Cad96Ca [Apostichopus japonicus]
MSLKINDVELNQSDPAPFWIGHDESLDIVCTASDSRPSVNVSWRVNNQTVDNWPFLVTSDGQSSYTTTSKLTRRPNTFELENITCLAIGLTSHVYSMTASIHSYVLPRLIISVNGNIVDKTTSFEYGANLAVTCYAVDGRPESVVWFTDYPLDPLPSARGFSNSSFSFQFLSNLERITCTSFQKKIGKLTNITVTLAMFNDEPLQVVTLSSGEFSHFNWIIPSVAALVTCFLFFCTYKTIKRLRSSISVNLSTNQDNTGPTDLQMDDLMATDQSTTQKSLQGSFRQKQKSDLPDIPSEEVNSLHSTGSESNYYSAAKESAGKDRIYSENDFCLLLSIKMGTIYNRWMGTIKHSSDVNKCVVFTTVAEGMLKKKIIQWDGFVKRNLDLPKTDHLTKIQGIAVQETTLYLISEHIVCETLDCRLTFDPTSQGTQSPLLVPDVMKHISGILEGMECIISYGFLHPGFSTKKILYTKQGICKLYDFCLAEDAPRILTLKKTQMNSITLNQFPPEGYFRNEYTAESDVWCTAVVIWEILSNGKPPFPVDEDITPAQDLESPKLTWPQRYLQLNKVNKTQSTSEQQSEQDQELTMTRDGDVIKARRLAVKMNVTLFVN